MKMMDAKVKVSKTVILFINIFRNKNIIIASTHHLSSDMQIICPLPRVFALIKDFNMLIQCWCGESWQREMINNISFSWQQQFKWNGINFTF